MIRAIAAASAFRSVTKSGKLTSRAIQEKERLLRTSELPGGELFESWYSKRTR